LDLLDWVDSTTLTAWIWGEVDDLLEVSAPHESPGVLGVGSATEARDLLAVLAYGYLTQEFESEAIERACRTDLPFLALCEGNAPFAVQLTTFRRRNRGFLVTLLVRVLTRAVRERLQAGNRVLPRELKQRLHENVVGRLDTARHMDGIDVD
jgi:transposase